ncbi:MAG: ligand-binding sensor domain-containing protein, partial [Planctomycetota bacterium]
MSVEKKSVKKGTWRTYTPSNGLAALKCEHLIEDRQGYLWIATCTGGISRFDGEVFTTFTVSDGLCGIQVYSVFEDRQGR